MECNGALRKSLNLNPDNTVIIPNVLQDWNVLPCDSLNSLRCKGEQNCNIFLYYTVLDKQAI